MIIGSYFLKKLLFSSRVITESQNVFYSFVKAVFMFIVSSTFSLSLSHKLPAKTKSFLNKISNLIQLFQQTPKQKNVQFLMK